MTTPLKAELAKIVMPARAELLMVIATMLIAAAITWVATTLFIPAGAAAIPVAIIMIMFLLIAGRAGVTLAATPRVWFITRVLCIGVYAAVFWGPGWLASAN